VQQTSKAYEKRSGAATTRDGITLQYTIFGTDGPARPRIALVHSLAMNGAVWDAVVERLVADATVLVYDCRGHGASTKAPGPYTLEIFANDLADLMDQVGWQSAHVAGASMGGCVALQFALDYPARTRSLGLIDTTSWYGPDAPKNWETRAQKAKESGFGSMLAFQQTRWFTDDFRARNPQLVRESCDLFAANDLAAYMETCRMLGSFDLRARLGELRMPTAVIVGDEDYAAPPEMARVMADGIAGATLRVIPKARHLTFLEVPEIVADEMAKLVARVPAG
jgi:3-oxoadipate enol-lactonase